MIAIGIVIHSDFCIVNKEEYSETTDTFEMLCHLIDTIDMFTKEEYILIIRDNDSFDYRFKAFHVFLKKKFKHINTLFIASNINSLTDAWNEIIRVALDDLNCEAVILLNQDILVTKNWNNFVKAVKIQSNNTLGPMVTSNVYQPLQQVKEENFKEENIILHVPSIQGSCWGFSRKALKENMYDNNHYFNSEVEWDYNEEEWIQRNNNKGGKTLIVKNAFVIHLDTCSWTKAGLRSTKRPELLYPIDYTRTVLGQMSYEDYLRGSQLPPPKDGGL